MTFDRFDQFEAYTNNTLPDEQREQLEQQLAANATFRAELTDYQQFRHSLEAIALKQQLTQIHGRLDRQGALTPPPLSGSLRQGRRLRPAWAGAAVVICLAIFGLFWTLRPTATERIGETYYKPEPVARGATDCGPELTPSIRAYRAGNYPMALSALEKISVNQPCVRYYRGLAQLALGDPSAAIAELEQAALQSSPEPDLTNQKTEWYLAMAYLKDDQPAKAHRQLQKIVNQPGHPFRQEAQKALRDLDHA